MFDHKSRYGCVVVHRIRVGHRADRRESSGYGSRRAARDRFFIFVARLAQVNMHVYETGRDDQSRSIENLGAFGNGIAMARQANHAAIFDEQIFSHVDSLCGIDEITVLNQ